MSGQIIVSVALVFVAAVVLGAATTYLGMRRRYRQVSGRGSCRMVVWITKHALTRGIFQTTVVLVDARRAVVRDLLRATPTYYRGSEWHTSLKAAELRARHMRQKNLIGSSTDAGEVT